MVFAHDSELAMMAAVALASSAQEPDTLTTRDQLREFFVEHGFTGQLVGDLAELEAVRALRPALLELFTSPRDDAAQIVNVMLRDGHARPRLVRHGEVDWHVHAADDDGPLATRIAVEAAMAMIDVIRADELSRLGVCADADCQAIVLDLSRNRSRRFCSTTCGNRAAVAAYRARRSL